MISIIITVVDFIKYSYLTISSLLGFKKSITKLREVDAERFRKKNIEYHQKIASVYPILQDTLHSHPEIDRVTVFRSHNGDGIPQIGKLSYTSCIQEVLTNKTTPITDRWQNIPNDKLMVDCITSMMLHGSANLPSYDASCPIGILTDFCKGNNIKNVLAVPISYTKTGFIFLNFCSATCEDMEGVDGILFEANSCAGRVKELIEK
jgi:hypothetical protein